MNNVADTGCVFVIMLLAAAVMIGFALRECSTADEPEPQQIGSSWTLETPS
jgi:hypothetical protein